MGRPVLLAVAAALLLVLPGAGAAVTRLRVSANFVSTGGGPGEAVESGGGGRRAAPRSPPSLCLQECRATGE